jgi:hypothetical protein
MNTLLLQTDFFLQYVVKPSVDILNVVVQVGSTDLSDDDHRVNGEFRRRLGRRERPVRVEG